MLSLTSNSSNFLRSLPDLTPPEQYELSKLLATPVVVKYLNLVLLNAAAELVLTDATAAASNPNAFIAHQAFVKGTISVVDTILSNLNPSKE